LSGGREQTEKRNRERRKMRYRNEEERRKRESEGKKEISKICKTPKTLTGA
jgi:hypothetical protein